MTRSPEQIFKAFVESPKVGYIVVVWITIQAWNIVNGVFGA